MALTHITPAGRRGRAVDCRHSSPQGPTSDNEAMPTQTAAPLISTRHHGLPVQMNESKRQEQEGNEYQGQTVSDTMSMMTLDLDMLPPERRRRGCALGADEIQGRAQRKSSDNPSRIHHRTEHVPGPQGPPFIDSSQENLKMSHLGWFEGLLGGNDLFGMCCENHHGLVSKLRPSLNEFLHVLPLKNTIPSAKLLLLNPPQTPTTSSVTKRNM